MALDREQAARRMAEVAAGFVGTVEAGGANRGAQVERFQRANGGQVGEPWCADFVCYCARKAYADVQGVAYTPASAVETFRGLSDALRREWFLPHPSCTAMLNGAKRAGRWVPRGGVQAQGLAAPCLAIFDFDRDGRANHIGLVTAFGAEGPQTIEGNTSAGPGGSQDNGDGVYRRADRRYAQVLGYIRLF